MHDQLFSQNRDLLHGLVSQYNEIGIIVGEPHDSDKIAAALSLYLSLLTLGKDIQIVSQKDPIVEYSSFFGIDRIAKEFRGAVKTFTISVPNNEGEIEKVTCTVDNGKLNINLFAGEKKVSFTEEDIRFIKKGSTPFLIFTIGVSDFSDLKGVLEESPDMRIVNIDNKMHNTIYGDVVYVDQSFSSLSEVVARIIRDMGWGIDMDIAQNLMDGLSVATDNFTAPQTSLHAFEAASFLLRSGAARRSLKEEKRRDVVFETSGPRSVLPQNQRNSVSHQAASPQRPVQSQKIGIASRVIRPTSKQPSHQNWFDTLPQEEEATPVPPIQKHGEKTNSDQVPDDWFTPKVFKSSTKQGA